MTGPVPLLETQRIKLSNGRLLRMTRTGSGTPIVFLHGYPENLQVWSHLLPLLADDFDVMAFDWPGMGDSEEWPGGATPKIKASRLLSILDELGLTKPVIVGMDMGGQPGLAFAAMHPDRVERLVVMNSLVFGDAKTSWEIRLLRRFGFNRFVLRNLPRLVMLRAEHTFLPAGVRIDANLRADFWNTFSRPNVRRFVSKMCAGYQATLDQLPEMYRSITCPTLVLWAEHDKHFPLVQAQRLHATITNAALDVIPGGTHWMPLDRADDVAASIRRWIGSSCDE